jgi:class 3 adenylate cyclase
MFCDLVGSTALSTRFAPENLRELIGEYHRAVSETVGRRRLCSLRHNRLPARRLRFAHDSLGKTQ